jgi:addiction module HigA family antidote
MTETYTFQPDRPSPPGDTIAAVLRERNMTQADLAQRTGYSRKHVNDVIRARKPISFEAALKLEAVLGSTADFWMRREIQYQEARARQKLNQEHARHQGWLKELPLNEMIRLGYVTRHPDRGKQVTACLSFFGVASVSAWQKTYAQILAAFESSSRSAQAGSATAAWIRQGEILAEKMETTPYCPAALRASLPELRRLTAHTDPRKILPRLTTITASAGIAVIRTPAPGNCPASGATRWLAPEKALLMLGHSYRTLDSFWFLFFHEICHILRHSKKAIMIEGVHHHDRRLENEADRFAADLLIPPDQARKLPELGNDRESIVRFAREIGVAPGIVVGRMQKEGLLGLSRCSDLKVRYPRGG